MFLGCILIWQLRAQQLCSVILSITRCLGNKRGGTFQRSETEECDGSIYTNPCWHKETFPSGTIINVLPVSGQLHCTGDPCCGQTGNVWGEGNTVGNTYACTYSYSYYMHSSNKHTTRRLASSDDLSGARCRYLQDHLPQKHRKGLEWV